MNNKLNILGYVNGILLAIVMAFSSSCDLQLQEQFEFEDDIPELARFDMTVMEWLDQNPQDQFTYMLEAIERAGLRDLYDNADDNRTFLLLRNDAWTESNEILSSVAGDASYPLDSIPVATLRHILKYHIVDAYVDQGPSLLTVDAPYGFQTLIEGDSGRIYFSRNYSQNLSVNSAGSLLPGDKKNTGVSLHNYIFKNGVAHQLNAHVRYQPYYKAPK